MSFQTYIKKDTIKAFEGEEWTPKGSQSHITVLSRRERLRKVVPSPNNSWNVHQVDGPFLLKLPYIRNERKEGVILTISENKS